MSDRRNPPRWVPGQLPDEENAQRIIAAKYSADLTAMTALHDLVMTMVSNDWTVPRRGINRGVVLTVVVVLNKCLKTFRAIQILAERGFVMHAHVLNRQLAEQAIAIRFILQKRSKERGRLYRAYGANEMLKMVRHWQRTKGLRRRASTRVIAVAEQRLKQWTDQLPANVDYRSHWSGTRSLEEAMRQLHLEALYASLFRFTSRYTHGVDFEEHIDRDERQPAGYVFTLTPEVTGVDGVSLGAREMLWFAASTIDKKFKLGYESALAAHRVKKPAA